MLKPVVARYRLFKPLKFLPLGILGFTTVAAAQDTSPPPPAVGVSAEKRPITETNEFIGRIQAMSRVAIVARVTAFLDEVKFQDGADVKKGDVLYQLERSPLEADLVGQDPMYVTFPISVRTTIALRERYAGKGGRKAVVIRIRLPDGRMYGEIGKLDFADNTVQTATDTLTVRGIIPNPVLSTGKNGVVNLRELADNEFVGVELEGVDPVEVLAVPRAAVLTDQQGDYVFGVDAQNKAQRQNVKLGQSTPTVAAVTSGLKEGDRVIVEGLQRVRAGQPVSPGPAAAPAVPSAPPTATQ